MLVLAFSFHLAAVSASAWVVLVATAAIAAMAGVARRYRARAALLALHRQDMLTRWKVACTVGWALGPALLGLMLTGLAVVVEAVEALDSQTSKDITIPLIVALVGAALYDRIVHAQDLYWEAIDDSRWRVGIFVAAAVVGAAGFTAIVRRTSSSLSVAGLALGAWLGLGLVLAPVLGLAAPHEVAIACYAGLLLGILVCVLRGARWGMSRLDAVSWSMTWSLLAAVFSFSAYRLVLYQ